MAAKKKTLALPPIYARIPAVVHAEADGTYWAKVPMLPGCYTRGDTLAELERNLQDAVELYLDGIEDQMAAPPASGHGEIGPRAIFAGAVPPRRAARKKSS